MAETLSYGSYVSATHNLNTAAVQPFFDAVEKATDESLKFRMFTDSTVVGASNALNGIRDGVVDMALVVDVYTPSLLPTNATLSDLALFPSTTAAGAAATNEMTLLHCDQCLKDWKKIGVQPLAFYSTAPYHLMCVDKVNDLESIRGKRVRATSAWANWTATMGAIPVSISSAETYAALNRGTIDCGFGATAWLDTYGLEDVVGYVLDMPVGAYRGGNFLNIGLDEWKALSDAERAAIKKHLASAVANAVWSYENKSTKALQDALDSGSVQLVEPGEGLKKRYDELLKNERERVIALAKKRGIENPEALVDRYLDLLTKWEKIVAGLDSKEEYAAALDKHIYQKVEL